MSLNLREYLSMLIREHGIRCVMDEMISLDGLPHVVNALKDSVLGGSIVFQEQEAKVMWSHLSDTAQAITYLDNSESL